MAWSCCGARTHCVPCVTVAADADPRRSLRATCRRLSASRSGNAQKARFASAMRCVSSRRLIVAPVLLKASSSSLASFSCIDLPGRASRRRQKPAHRQRLAARPFDLHRDLVRRAADAAGLDLDHRRRVAKRLLEHLERGPAGALRDPVQRAVDDALGQALLAALHHLVDEPREHLALVPRVRRRNPALDLCPSWHIRSLDRSRRRRPPIASIRRSATRSPYTRKSGERLMTSGRFSHRVQSVPP